MVTGAYYPEIAGGALQARELIRALRDRVDFVVLTTSAAASETVEVDGVAVHRVAVDLASWRSRLRGTMRLLRLLPLERTVGVVHLQSVSGKNVILTATAKLFRRPLVLTLQTGVHDDADVVRSRSPLGFLAFRKADVIVGVSEALRDASARAGIPEKRLRWIPNGVDTARFRPATADERSSIRRRLALPQDKIIIMFVGFFSREKGPHRLFAAWKQLPPAIRDRSVILYIGQTGLPHTEVDPGLIDEIRREAAELRASPVFVERTQEIEEYYRASDVFVLASTREGCPNALLEAIASGLPAISARLAGSTDSIITDPVDGWLVEPDEVEALSAALHEALSNPLEAAARGTAARATACRLFSLERVSEAYFQIYQGLTA